MVSWYTSASHHVTPDLSSLSSATKYNGPNALRVGNGNVLPIQHTASTSLYTPHTSFHLNNVLYVPHITKPLLSVQKFTRDNNVFFEFHPSYFYVKDCRTKNTLLPGLSKDDLYILSTSASHSPSVHSDVCVTADCWHHWLSHPHRCTLHQIVSTNKLPCSSAASQHLCSTFQLGKSSRFSLVSQNHYMRNFL